MGGLEKRLIAWLAVGVLMNGPTYAQTNLSKLEGAMAAAAATSMPASCESEMLKDDVRANLPRILGLGPDAASIVEVDPFPSTAIYKTPRGGDVIECDHVEVHWSNGLVTVGTFKEWQDDYGQIDVGWLDMRDQD